MESNERQMDRLLSHEWKKFNRIFWLSAVAIIGILGLAAGIIFIAKDTDKGTWLIVYTVSTVLALLAGRGILQRVPKPPQQ